MPKRVNYNKKNPKSARSRDAIKQVLYRAFRREFPDDTVDISDGYKENIHVLIVSRRFDDMIEAEKQDLMWRVVGGTDLTETEKQLISLVYPVAVAEIK